MGAADGCDVFGDVQLVPGNDGPVLELTPVVTAKTAARNGNDILRVLCSQVPLKDLPHVKRVRKLTSGGGQLQLLLCALPSHGATPVAEAATADAAAERPEAAEEGGYPGAVDALIQQHGLVTEVAYVPRHAPVTREQWEEWTRVWPLTWRVPAADGHQSRHLVAREEVLKMRQAMAHALGLGRRSSAPEPSGIRNAAVLVEPESGRVVASGVDDSDSHPLHHAVMMAIQHASHRDSFQSAACDPLSSGSPDSPRADPPCKLQRQQPHADVADSASRSGDAAHSSDATAPRPYLCTGLDCYVLHEPCMMCAMALVHSRVRSVVFCVPSSQRGALHGPTRLHGQAQLNHRYRVYQMHIRQGALDFGQSSDASCG